MKNEQEKYHGIYQKKNSQHNFPEIVPFLIDSPEGIVNQYISLRGGADGYFGSGGKLHAGKMVKKGSNLIMGIGGKFGEKNRDFFVQGVGDFFCGGKIDVIFGIRNPDLAGVIIPQIVKGVKKHGRTGGVFFRFQRGIILGYTAGKRVVFFAYILFQPRFHEIRASGCHHQKADHAKQEIAAEKFGGDGFFHEAFTSNLYPIPQTVASDQPG